MRVFENKVLRRLFGATRDKVTGEWRKLRSEELTDLYSSPNIFQGDHIQKNEIGGARSTCGGERGVYEVLLGKSEGKRPLGRPSRR